MRKLGDRNYTLISQAVKIHGTFNPNLILYLFEEQLYTSEFDEVVAFLTWVHENDKTFGSGNYEEVFSEWKKSNKKAKEGDLISFKTCSNANAKLLRGVVEHKDQLGLITFVDGVQYELNKLLNITVLRTKNPDKKVAKLVCVSLMTRIVVEDNLTEEELLQEIRQTAFPKFHAQLCEDGVGDHLESIEDDTECPYGTIEGDK